MKNSKKSLVTAADRYASVNDGGKEHPLQTLFTSGDDVQGVNDRQRDSRGARASFHDNRQIVGGAGGGAGHHSTLNIAIKARHASTNVMLSPAGPHTNEKLGTYDSQAKA